MTRRGIHTLDDLQQRCTVNGKHWLWDGAVSRGRPAATIGGSRVLGARITAVVMGRADERTGDQRWTARCGQALCLSPHCLLLAKSQRQCHRIASAAGRLKRSAAQRAAISLAHQKRGHSSPEWMVQWALESGQSSRVAGEALGVHHSTVRAWRGATKNLRIVTGPFSQLLLGHRPRQAAGR